MSEEKQADVDTLQLPEVEVEEGSRFSIIWLIPLVAALIGMWLAYKTVTEMGPTITITFKSGEGLEAGKTKIKYQSVKVGTVETVEISDDLSHVIVTAKMDKGSESHLTEHTRFWVVRPRVGLGGVSGLETLVSGAYIGVDPMPGASATAFTGLEKPPGVTASEAGAQFVLRAEKLGSCYPGAPIYYRDIEVGRILSHQFSDEDDSVLIDIFIRAPHHLRVRDTSRFWQRQGLEVDMSAEGVNVEMPSLASLISGGVSFDTPVTAGGSNEPSQPGTVFKVFKNFKSMGEAKYVRKVPYLIHFDSSVRGLTSGAPVEFRGIKIGSVTDVAVKIDPKSLDIEIPVIIEIEPERITTPEFQASHEPYKVGAHMVERGLRAQLQTGSLLTGQLFVMLDFHPDLPQQSLIMSGKYPEIPTVPSTMQELEQTVHNVLTDIRKLPLDQISHELLGAMKGANRLTNSPELLTSIRNVNAAVIDLRKLTREMHQTLADVADPNSPTMVNLASTLEELSDAARSIRVFAEYLERHPEALVRGKSQ